MPSLTDTFLECCLRLLNVQQIDGEKARDLATVIQTLDLSPANLSVGIVFVYKYQHNSINSLAFDKSDSLPYFIIMASLILSNKYLNDQSYTLKTWQGVLSKHSRFEMSLGMLNQLEQNVLVSMDYVLNVKHEPALWDGFADLNQANVTSLRYNVAVTATPNNCGHDEHLKMACGAMSSPQLMAAAYTSPMTYASNASYNSSPNMGGPLTPVSLPGRGFGGQAHFQMYTSPSEHFASNVLAPYAQLVPQPGAVFSAHAGASWDMPVARKEHMPMAPEMAVYQARPYGF